jgi:aminoglycoside/choline kinase family phosphotransferase
MEVLDASDSRLAHLWQWVVEDLGFTGFSIAPASVDASFRRYFRVARDADSYIVMDAPPEKEDSAPFVKVARILAGMNLNVPIVLARDMDRGFLLLSDLGSRQYLDELPKTGAADRLYAGALAALRTMQTADPAVSSELPRYDRALLLREMELMPEWFVRYHLGAAISTPERTMLSATFENLIRAASSHRPPPSCIAIIIRAISWSRRKIIPVSWISRTRCGVR